VQGFQAGGDRMGIVGRDHAIGDVAQAVAVAFDDAPACEAQSRIDSKQPDHVRIGPRLADASSL
jgi:hypothetical protein